MCLWTQTSSLASLNAKIHPLYRKIIAHRNQADQIIIPTTPLSVAPLTVSRKVRAACILDLLQAYAELPARRPASEVCTDVKVHKSSFISNFTKAFASLMLHKHNSSISYVIRVLQYGYCMFFVVQVWFAFACVHAAAPRSLITRLRIPAHHTFQYIQQTHALSFRIRD